MRFPSAMRFPSEGRLSIRESLRIFSLLTASLPPARPASPGPATRAQAVRAGSSFERLFPPSLIPGTASMSGPPSCGNTLRCFASLFLLPGAGLDGAVDGSPAAQLLANPNLLLYAWRLHLDAPVREALGLAPRAAASREAYSRFSQGVARSSAGRGERLLRGELMGTDGEHALPRVLFCSVAWIKDHQFCVVKHSNERFQVVQGYLKQDADDGGTGGRRGNPAFSAGRESAGFGLAGWQEVNSRRIQGRQYGAREGIGKRRMEHFLDGLQGFARNDVFDASGYEDVFGVHHAGGQRYWPSVSHRELLDEHIVGSGERGVADALERQLKVGVE
ncbi:hypothetical protein TeGR_g3385 [Tetraparma gracilis]|uniref:Uncharacterized protein n=1 Tax=Tetraparma gracilis TaxID=2962635 RepID=A0ABQ6N368_9STRA|nr:hypothetical protein TeGR_g3385 [Tetraparma gracilis]